MFFWFWCVFLNSSCKIVSLDMFLGLSIFLENLGGFFYSFFMVFFLIKCFWRVGICWQLLNGFLPHQSFIESNFLSYGFVGHFFSFCDPKVSRISINLIAIDFKFSMS